MARDRKSFGMTAEEVTRRMNEPYYENFGPDSVYYTRATIQRRLSRLADDGLLEKTPSHARRASYFEMPEETRRLLEQSEDAPVCMQCRRRSPQAASPFCSLECATAWALDWKEYLWCPVTRQWHERYQHCETCGTERFHIRMPMPKRRKRRGT